MKYMGSKSRIAKNILPLILKDRKPGQWYVEPFCGGCNSIDKVDSPRLAGDVNKYLIAMWNGLKSDHERPKEISRELYNRARVEFNNGTNIEFDDFMIGWIGFMGSFNGRFYDGGYAKLISERNYIEEQIRNTEWQIRRMKDIVFKHSSYEQLEIPKNSIIYCDPPYSGTKEYSDENFDSKAFWDWCLLKVSEGHSVFVSEYAAPPEFRAIWEKEVPTTINPTLIKHSVEKLFVHRDSNQKSLIYKQTELF